MNGKNFGRKQGDSTIPSYHPGRGKKAFEDKGRPNYCICRRREQDQHQI